MRRVITGPSARAFITAALLGTTAVSPGFYGTFDMNGNVYQWDDLDGAANAARGVIGRF